MTGISRTHELNLHTLRMEMDLEQLQNLPDTACPGCGERSLAVEQLDIRLGNLPADIEDAQAQHRALRQGRLNFCGTYILACGNCEFRQEADLEGEGCVFAEG